jgi:hypothetical protein
VQRWVAFFDKLVAAVVANKADCGKMASEVSTVIDRNQSAIIVARQARDARKKLPVAVQEHMLDGVKQMAPGIQNCGNKDNVKAAFSKLDVGNTDR